ncbi:hypothetical protein BKA69DRAFT_898145 [Paraphysoderma sedebokerense]|nr:hypothetical protein BKA69DRAFT_898145 [Paraphysoderma sedebokerense]
MSNLTVFRNYTLGWPPIYLGFNPTTADTSNGAFTYYLHTEMEFNLFLQKKNATHDTVSYEVVPAFYDPAVWPLAAYDMAQSNNGDIIIGLTEEGSPQGGIGGHDIAVFKYSPTLELKAQFLFSTIKQDTFTKLFLPTGDGNTVLISGFTNGHPNLTREASAVTRVFVAQFEFFHISNVATRLQNYVTSGETINITFSSVPTSATSGIPIVRLDQQPCQNVKWMGSVLSASIPPGAGGPFAIIVQFHYLPHSPSVSAQNYTYIRNPVILDVQPREGPASGYNISLTAANITTDESSLFIFIGKALCADVRRMNATVITCRTPAGSGKNVPVVLSVIGLVNNTENFNVSYEPPQIFEISPQVISTTGASITIKGLNFGPCNSSPCVFSNIAINVGSFGSCNNGIHWNDTDLQCNVPEGFNVNIPVSLTVNGQNAAPVVISYEKPVIWV